MSWNIQNKFGEFQNRLSKNGFKGNIGFSSGSFAIDGDKKTQNTYLSSERLNIHNNPDFILMKSKSGPKSKYRHKRD